ncbi:fumarylacetoacetate hydrolase family protein [Nocardia sp. CA2R105]|uniref:fumarylacetoacetate hydrolase family protein n=1 Tax=Nocardia coffeae TaxID=2873381 RepID=UPI001CA6BB41|nr:fumarylacetoacetate hydrolase family protein [Nocardia coffeae]MBY8863452.1 fumarylacetoacetate hydrolase family protein [Nocardia coffeae]
MRLATVRLDGTTAAARLDGEGNAYLIEGCRDLSELLGTRDWRSKVSGPAQRTVQAADLDYAPVVPCPSKIICVGLNYRHHIAEMGHQPPEYPTLFTKFSEALTGPCDDVIVPEYAANQMDWEGELAVVIGTRAYRVSEADAANYIAGYTVINDFTMRDYQNRTSQWDQGKNFEKTSGFGPYLSTDYVPGTRIETRLDGELVQSASTDDLVFGPARLIEYISHIVTLQPGDVISTGTPGGVGHAREPQRYIEHGQTVEVSVGGLGSVRNRTIVLG